MMLSAVTFGCSAPARPKLRDASSAPQTCAEAATAAFPGGKRGTLEAYRHVERRCGSLAELAEHGAYDGEGLRFDCVPADILEVGATIRRRGTDVPHPPPDLLGTAVCGQFNRECTDYDEIRRDQAEVVRRPTIANRELFVTHRNRLEACNQRYSR
jgi:hypothetical protein